MLVFSSLSYIHLSRVVKKVLCAMAEFQVVRETSKGVLTYPPDLPKDRGNLAQKCASYFSAVLFSVSGYIVRDAFDSWQDTLIFIGVAATNTISFYVFLHIAIKSFTFIEDYCNHLHTRHHDSVFGLIKKSFCCNVPSVLLGGLSFVLTPWAWYLYGFEYMFTCGFKPLLPIFAASFFLQWLVKMDWSHLVDSIRVEEMNGMDYGSGMAYSFFYGFLHIVLPVTGDENKGIRERIDMYIGKEGLNDDQFPVKKLFILIPSSKYIPCSLEELSEGWMEPAKSLEEQQFNVAGVRSRSYKNSVYKIRDPALQGRIEYKYVVAEGATPLRTLHEVVKCSIAKSEFYREHEKEIVHMFFKTLRNILREDERTKNNCELIYYIGGGGRSSLRRLQRSFVQSYPPAGSYADDDEHGDKINIAKLILNRIEELKKKDADRERRRRNM